MGDEEQGSAAPAVIEQPAGAAPVVEKPPRKKPGPKPKVAPAVEAAVVNVTNVAPTPIAAAFSPPAVLAIDPQVALFRAHAKAMQNAKAVEKSSTNAFAKFDYASSEDVMEEGVRAIAPFGLGLLPLTATIVEKGVRAAQQRDGSETMIPALWLERTFLLHHEDGGSITVAATPWPIIEAKGKPLDKAQGSADTTQLGYFWRTLLGIKRGDPSDDMHGRDDGPRDRHHEDQRDRQQQPAPVKTKPSDGLDRLSVPDLFAKLVVPQAERPAWIARANGYGVVPRSFTGDDMAKAKAALIEEVRTRGATNNGVGGEEGLPY